jgi:hypothetical protein
MTKWSSILDRYTHKDSSKIKLVFFKVSSIFYEFQKFELTYGIFKGIMKFEKTKTDEQCRAKSSRRPAVRAGQKAVAPAGVDPAHD